MNLISVCRDNPDHNFTSGECHDCKGFSHVDALMPAICKLFRPDLSSAAGAALLANLGGTASAPGLAGAHPGTAAHFFRARSVTFD